jgi:hypothetical protein
LYLQQLILTSLALHPPSIIPLTPALGELLIIAVSSKIVTASIERQKIHRREEAASSSSFILRPP